MKYKILIFSCLTIFAVSACKNAKKTTSNESSDMEDIVANETHSTSELAPKGESADKIEPKVEETPADLKPSQAEIEKHKPHIADNLFFGMYRTPCFGQCPYYNLDIDLNGYAVLEGKKFFDYEGFFETTLSEAQMDEILSLADKYGYFDFEHVYDAPVTDLPSTTTILRSEQGVHWVYNRLNSPETLREFEMAVETILKDWQWSPIEKKK